MPFESPLAEPARTRRSIRNTAAPVPAQSEATPDAAVAPLVVEAAVVATAIAAADGVTDAATPEPTVALDAAAVLPATPAAALPPMSRRAARAAAAAAAATIAEPVRVAAEPFELIEPPVETEPLGADTPRADAPAAETHSEPLTDAESEAADAFEAAARLFSFTGETTIVTEKPESAASDHDDVAEAVAAHAAARGARRRRGLVAFQRVTAASFSIGVMGVVGLLTVGLTTPAEAVASSVNGEATVSVRAPIAEKTEAADAADEIQAYVAPSSVENVDLSRHESYSTMTMAELAAESGIKNVSNFFVNDPNAAIQWPFAVGVPITYGFGMRSGAMHNGVDFVPGAGAPVQAIADGTVRVATNSGGGYGVHVIIDHVVDGELVSSHYAHLITGSITVTEGQQVTVGTVIGRTGNTGRSFGAHTHFEILLNGTTPIDPIPWLRQHAGG